MSDNSKILGFTDAPHILFQNSKDDWEWEMKNNVWLV